jgi:hypothetical protein
VRDARLPLAVHNTWVIQHDPAGPADQAQLLIFIGADLAADRLQAMAEDIDRRAPELVDRLRTAGAPPAGPDWPAAHPFDDSGAGSAGSGAAPAPSPFQDQQPSPAPSAPRPDQDHQARPTGQDQQPPRPATGTDAGAGSGDRQDADWSFDFDDLDEGSGPGRQSAP